MVLLALYYLMHNFSFQSGYSKQIDIITNINNNKHYFEPHLLLSIVIYVTYYGEIRASYLAAECPRSCSLGPGHGRVAIAITTSVKGNGKAHLDDVISGPG